MALPDMAPMARAASSAQTQTLPDMATPGDVTDSSGTGQDVDVAIITKAAATDPVIAAIARVIGIQ